MKSLTKLAVCAIAFAGISMASAETFNLADKTFFRKHMGDFTTTGTQFTTKGMTFIMSHKTFDIDPAKKYTFKMTLKNNAPKPFRLYIGFNLFDAKGRAHQAIAWQGFTRTFTQVSRAAKKGDKVIYVKDGARWIMANSAFIARNAKADNSDIPNTTIIPNSTVKSKKKVGNEWEITLNVPLKENLSAGESIRQHVSGAYFYSIIRTVKPTEKEIVLTKTIQGYAKTLNGFNGVNWPIGAKKVQLLILADWGTKIGTPLIFKDATFTIE